MKSPQARIVALAATSVFCVCILSGGCNPKTSPQQAEPETPSTEEHEMKDVEDIDLQEDEVETNNWAMTEEIDDLRPGVTEER